MTELDPRLERHRPALRYDSQEGFRAISAASITDNDGNVLLARDGAVIAHAGAGLSLDFLAAYPPPQQAGDGDKLDEAPDPLSASQKFQADPDYADRCYGRVVSDGDRTWLQYWLWMYDNPKNLLGFGRHEGDWELVQIGLGADDRPEVVTVSAHEGGEARDWDAGAAPRRAPGDLRRAVLARELLRGRRSPLPDRRRQPRRRCRPRAPAGGAVRRLGRLARPLGELDRRAGEVQRRPARRPSAPRARAARARSGSTRPRGTAARSSRRRSGGSARSSARPAG